MHLTLEDLLKRDFSDVPAGAHPSAIFVVPEDCNSCQRFQKLLDDFSSDATFMGSIYQVNSSVIPWNLPVFPPVVLLADVERQLPYCGPLHFMHLNDAIHQFSNGVRAARLDDSNFEHDTQASTSGTTGDWLILFDSLDEPIMRMYDGLSLNLRARSISLGILDPTKAPWTAKRFSVDSTKLPSMLMLHRSYLFRFSRPFHRTDFDRILRFAIEEFHSHPKSVIPRPRMYFDAFVDSFVFYYKALEKNYGTHVVFTAFIGFVLSTVILMSLAVLLCFWWAGSFETHQTSSISVKDRPHEAGDDGGRHLSKKSKRE